MSKHTFWIAGIYGFLALLPQYFLEEKGVDFPPSITHPEYFYGFIGVALARQVAFIIIARNPLQYRTMMIPAILEKFSFGIAPAVLFSQGRIPSMMLGFGIIDLILGLLFIAAYFKTRAEE